MPSADKARARTRAGEGSPWLGKERRSFSWLPSKPSTELMAVPEGCSALAQLSPSGTQERPWPRASSG